MREKNGLKDKEFDDYPQGFTAERKKLCVLRNEGGRGLASLEDFADTSIQGVENYIKKSKETLITQRLTALTKNQKRNKKCKTEIGRKTILWQLSNSYKRIPEYGNRREASRGKMNHF